MLLLAGAGCVPLLNGQNPPATAAPQEQQIEQLRSSLSAAQAEVQACKQQIDVLRQQLQQIQAHLGISAANPPGSADFPTLPAVVEQEKKGPDQIRSGESEDEQMLAAKVNEYEQTKVESTSKYKVRISGMVLLNAFGTRGNPDIQDLPNLAFRTPAGQPDGNFGATLRQTQLGVEVTGPELAGARTSGHVEVDFFGGFPDANYGVTAGLLRLRTAEARLDWKNTSIVGGQAAPFFSPLSPTSYATLAEPAFSWAGNLWVWTPQIALERRWTTSESSHVSFQAGILDPLTEEIPDFQYNRKPTAGEFSRAPAFATYLAWKKAATTGELTLGGGAYYSRQDWQFGRTMDSWLVTAGWDLPLAHWLALSGEVYRGRAIGGLGGGVWASVLFNGPPDDASTSLIGLNDIGGWTQLKFRATSRLEFNLAAGGANPFARDLLYFATPTTEYFPPLARNQAFFVNGVYRPRANLLLALEYRRLRTYQLSGTKNSADHVNLAAGISF